MRTVNEVITQGMIISKFVPENGSVVFLTISAGKTSNQPDAQKNTPQIVFLGDLRASANEFNLYDHVTVTSHVQSKRKPIGDAGDKFIEAQSLVADEIVRTPTIMKNVLGVDSGNHYEPPKNSFELAGEVVGIYTPSKNMVKIKIKTVKDKRPSFVETTYFTRKVGEVMETIRVHDVVACVGNIQTTKKVLADKKMYFENVVIKDMTKIS